MAERLTDPYDDTLEQLIAPMLAIARQTPPPDDSAAMETGNYPSFLDEHRAMAKSIGMEICRLAERSGRSPIEVMREVRNRIARAGIVAAKELDYAWDGVGPWRV